MKTLSPVERSSSGSDWSPRALADRVPQSAPSSQSRAFLHGGEPLIVIVGPTAVGKTALSLRLAEAVGGEIVSADSRQVYRGMDVGTAKATPEERARVPHHLIDVVGPDETLSLAQFQELAQAAIGDIISRGCIPFLVGGTGQYVMAVVEGWKIPRVPPDEDLRRDLYRQAEQEGAEALHGQLRALDPMAAERIDPRNVRRVVRALEVCLVTCEPVSRQQRKAPPPYRILLVGLTMPRPKLYQRIDDRVDGMLAAGLEDEVRRLVAHGYGFDLPAMSGVGYGQFGPYLSGEATLEEIRVAIKRATRRFVRHQGNWFGQDDPRIAWYDVGTEPDAGILALVRDFLARGSSGMTQGPEPV
jgi:tRNA dimethylallyltransferase